MTPMNADIPDLNHGFIIPVPSPTGLCSQGGRLFNPNSIIRAHVSRHSQRATADPRNPRKIRLNYSRLAGLGGRAGRLAKVRRKRSRAFHGGLNIQRRSLEQFPVPLHILTRHDPHHSRGLGEGLRTKVGDGERHDMQVDDDMGEKFQFILNKFQTWASAPLQAPEIHPLLPPDEPTK